MVEQEYARHLVNSVWVRDVTPHALASGMLSLAGNATLRRALGATGRSQARAMYASRKIVRDASAVLRCVRGCMRGWGTARPKQICAS